MNLLTKVLLTLILVIAVGMLTVSLMVGRSATTAYQGYLGETMNQRLIQVADEAALLYAESGAWETVQTWLDQVGSSYRGNGFGMGQHGRGQGGMAQAVANRVLFVVDGATGQPLALPDSQPVPEVALAAGAPVRINSLEVARIVDIRDSQSAILSAIGPAEQTFLDRMGRALIISSMVAGLVALLVGSLLVYSMLRPLRALEKGVMQVAQGRLDTQVTVHSRDEIGQLALGFNRMAANLHRQEMLRQRMVADIAHELRTPLSVVQGNLQAMLDGIYPLEKSEIATIYGETRVLSRLIQDLHELAQAEAGSLPLALQHLDVIDVVTHMANLFRPLAEERGIRLLTRMPPGDAPPLLAVGDADRVQQILYNLIGNGLRHTPTDGTLYLWAKGMGPKGLVEGKKEGKEKEFSSDDYAKYVRFGITDSGPGIPPQDLPHIFDRFYRGDTSRTRAEMPEPDRYTSEAGLGLAIVKALVEAQGGRVGVESQPNEGATFWFDLPAA